MYSNLRDVNEDEAHGTFLMNPNNDKRVMSNLERL